MTYSYDRTSYDESEALKWVASKRRAAIRKHTKAMSDELNAIWEEAIKRFGDSQLEARLNGRIWNMERDLRDRLQ